MNSSYDEMLDSKCTSCEIAAYVESNFEVVKKTHIFRDKSAYWTPQL